MNRIEGITRTIKLESIVISTFRFYAPLNFVDSTRYTQAVNRLAKVFGLDTEGSIHMGDEMNMGRLKSRWCIIVKGYESVIDAFLKEVKKVTE